MHDARVVRFLLPDFVEDLGCLSLVGKGLVGLERTGVQRQAIEHRGLAVVRVALIHLLHRLFVGERTSLMVELVIVAIEGGDCCDVIRLARRLGRGRHRLGDCFGAGFERGRRRGVPERVPMTHRDAPIGHRTAGLGRGDRGELL